MNVSDALAALACRCGIATDYADPSGQRHAISAELTRALLTAMQLPMDDGPAEALTRLELEDCRRGLPAARVVQSGEPVRLNVWLPASAGSRTHRWTLRLENGETHTAEFVPANLTVAGTSRSIAGYAQWILELPAISSLGYHSFELDPPGGDTRAAMSLIVAPSTCYQPEAILGDKRVWGPSTQVFALRSRRNWGCGDFTDLRNLIDLTADAGGGIVGGNSLHALCSADAARAKPYRPSSRAFLNALYIDVEAVPEFRKCGAAQTLVGSQRFQARRRSLRADEVINFSSISESKAEVLELLYQCFLEHELSKTSQRAESFRRFVREGGVALQHYAWFEALQAHFRREEAGPDWRNWPGPYRDPLSPEVAEFAAAHASAVQFSLWLQWVAQSQLAEVGHQSWRRGLGIGLSLDLAGGVDPIGADAWRWQGVFAAGARSGVPAGNWESASEPGTVPFIPARLRAAAFRPFIEALRANMRQAGALRIQCATGFKRVFWVLDEPDEHHGAYVDYPFEDLLGIVALESHRNRCLVIGEHLGASTDTVSSDLIRAGVLSHRPFFLERAEDGAFQPPGQYPPQSLVSTSTPDHPTLHGFWQGSDLDSRAALGLFPSVAEREAAVVTRAQDRARLLLALDRERLLPEGASVHPVSVPKLTPPFVTAIHAYLARTPARVLMVQPEDILGIAEQIYLPGGRDDQFPNWRRRLTLDLEDWRGDERFWQIGEVLRGERGTSVTPQQAEEGVSCRAVIPRATYRLQFNRDFTFAQATELIPYLAELGISHCYASPYLKARPGSMHGYDIVDHGALNPEIGTPEEYDRFVATMRAHGMGHILDVVPNHMGVMGADNAWWLEVLENGPASAYGNFFDIDWDPLNPGLKGKVLLPLLGEHYGTILNRGELQLAFDSERGEFSLHYYQHRLPIDPTTYPRIIGHRQERLAEVMGKDDAQCVELQTLLTSFGHLPSRRVADPAQQAERQRDKEVHKRHLAALSRSSADILHHITENVRELNGRADDPASFDNLHDLIQSQGYRLAYWRVASDEINYRRFFDINDLAALRMEEPEVFEATHRFVLGLVAEGKIDGLRIDHPDGLYDPGQYFERVQQSVRGGPPAVDQPLPLYLVIEKILADHERLLDDWPIHGATGYRFANITNALFVDGSAERRMTRIYNDFVGASEDFDGLVYQAKKLIMDTALASELNVLANRLARIATASRDTCDFTLNNLREALAEVVACFPVYRSYVSASGLSPDDRRHIDWAVGVAKKRSPAVDISIFDFIHDVLTNDIAKNASETYREAILTAAMKFQQFSAPVMAKGLEDTVFYRYQRLVSLNDVGGDPRRFGISIAAYHAATRIRAQRWPHNQLATSTHDSKRSEDVRARINVLSEMPAAWKTWVQRWSRLNRARKRELDGQAAPSASDEYLLYQTLVGTWPPGDPAKVDLEAYRCRIEAYMIKAVREAKEYSSWVNVNSDYEEALAGFIAALLTPGEKNPFLAEFVPAVERVMRAGMINSLAQTLIKLTAPGVPDIYQGCELWQFNLVDPDNRRPVDFALRRRLLAEVKGLVKGPAERWPGRLQPLVQNMSDGRIKLYLTWQALQLRARSPDLFEQGEYLPLTVGGERADHVFAFARRAGARAIIAVAPRLSNVLVAQTDALPLGSGVWGGATIQLPASLAAHRWRNVLTGKEYEPSVGLCAGQVFADLPVALLESVPRP